MAGTFLISNDSRVQFQLGRWGAALENSCQRHQLVGGGGGGLGASSPRKFLKCRGLEMVFSMFSKRTQPG